MAIVFDASTVGGDGTVSYAHTCTGANRFLIVTTGNRGVTISGVTYGGVSLTNLLNNEGSRLSVWYLKDPASGSNTIVLQGATGGDNVNSIAVSYTGVYGIDSSNVATAATPNTVATTVVDTGCWLLGSGYGATSGSATISTNKTTRQTVQFYGGNYVIGAFDSNGAVSTGSQSITFTVGGVSPNTDIGLTYSITPNAPGTSTVNTLVIGGGGGGGSSAWNNGGGGGGGGYQHDPALAVTAQAYSITVGAGGAGGGSTAATDGTNGGDSIFSTITANGGGGGGGGGTNGSGSRAGLNGGSGGGASGRTSGGTVSGGTGSQGNNGGANSSGSAQGAGGGGAGAVGQEASASPSGGAGTSNSISGSAVVYAKGGTGWGGSSQGSLYGEGGSGASGANGNNGVVIISFPTDGSTGVSTSSTGGTITTSGGNQIHTFTTSGTWTMVGVGGGANANFLQFMR